MLDYLNSLQLELIKRGSAYYVEIGDYLMLLDVTDEMLTSEMEPEECHKILSKARDVAMSLTWDSSMRYLADTIAEIERVFLTKVKVGQTFKNSDDDNIFSIDYQDLPVTIILSEKDRVISSVMGYSRDVYILIEDELTASRAISEQLKIAKQLIDNVLKGDAK